LSLLLLGDDDVDDDDKIDGSRITNGDVELFARFFGAGEAA
jgi:hypothetical protein